MKDTVEIFCASLEAPSGAFRLSATPLLAIAESPSLFAREAYDVQRACAGRSMSRSHRRRRLLAFGAPG
jgi:hypothetical protein